jgi:uncharacterized HAD superfamily protein
MYRDIVSVLDKIKKFNVDIVVGIPRSGIAPAANIALNLQVPYGDLASYINGNVAGTSGKLVSPVGKTILLVDDTVNTGSAMQNAIKQIRAAGITDKIITFAVWHSDKTNIDSIDLTAGFCPRPRVFEWNLWKHHKLSRFGFDMDGVLCRDPSRKENDKGPKLLHFYKTADPKFIPERPVGYIITSRLEKYREVTEEWLRKHNIQYSKLIMKSTDEKHGIYKANILNNLNVLLYVESDPKQAKQISERVKIPIWCIDSQTLYRGI